MKQRAQQIRWTQREWKLIAEELVKRQVDPKERGWRGRLVDVMKAALPADRWRQADCLNDAKRMVIPLMRELQCKPIEPPKPGPEPAEPPKMLEHHTTEELVHELVRRFFATGDILKQLRDAMAIANASAVFVNNRTRKHDPSCPECAKEVGHGKRILIVGPRNGQQIELRQAVSDCHLVFVASDQNPALVGSWGASAEHIILWTNFISHSHQEQAKKLNAKLHYVTGGMTALHEKLKEIAE